MNWSADNVSGRIICMPAGRVDEATWEQFGDELKRAVARAATLPLQEVVVDLSRVAYMSSRGLRALTLAKREADAIAVTMILAAPNEIMREILAISRYDKVFSVVGSFEATP